MDPLTHTLAAAVLADSGVARGVRLGAVTLIVAANLPDVDAFTYFAGGDTALALRRGWTHGILAVALLPPALAAVVSLLAGRRRGEAGGGFLAHLPLAYLGLLTHPFLDWLNTYGIRLLMPFDRRWFYGDTLFIVDPWLWLALGGAVFLSHSDSRRSLAAWGALAAVTTVIFLLGSSGQPVPRAIWLGGLALLAALRVAGWRPSTGTARERLAAATLLAAGLYVGLLHASSVLAREDVHARLEAAGTAPEDVMVGPLPLIPLRHAVVVDLGNRYRVGSYDWFAEPRLRFEGRTLPAPPADGPATAALAAPCLRGMAGWARYPWVEIEEQPDGYVVHLMDARYTRERTRGFGGASVRVRGDLTPDCGAPGASDADTRQVAPPDVID